jgi:hypothetical protein
MSEKLLGPCLACLVTMGGLGRGSRSVKLVTVKLTRVGQMSRLRAQECCYSKGKVDAVINLHVTGGTGGRGQVNLAAAHGFKGDRK